MFVLGIPKCYVSKLVFKLTGCYLYNFSLSHIIFRAPRDELKQLVHAGGGLVTGQARIAKVNIRSSLNIAKYREKNSFRDEEGG